MGKKEKDIKEKTFVCPWWIGYFLINPLRKLSQPPEKILSPYIMKGMQVLEVGPGMGYFSLTLAKLVGYEGRIVCVDLQEKMLMKLRKRARRKELHNIIETRICSEKDLNLNDYQNTFDFALAFAVMHEVPDQENFLKQIWDSLKPESKLLISEPTGHVNEQEMTQTTQYATNVGFQILEHPEIKSSRSVLLLKSKED